MKNIRRLLGGVVLGLFTFGYLASQYAYFSGTAPTYAKNIDTPQVKLLSLVLFLASIALAFIPAKADEE
ncbi:hypothetical protein BH11ARM1_BH11ARM1_09350 [soil metagenome]